MPRSQTISVNRAPVLTLWAAIVAQRLGFDEDEALTLGRAVAGLNAYSKGVSLGLFQPSSKEVKEQRAKLKHGEQLTVVLQPTNTICSHSQFADEENKMSDWITSRERYGDAIRTGWA